MSNSARLPRGAPQRGTSQSSLVHRTLAALVQTQALDSEGLRGDPQKFFICNKFPGDTGAGGPGTNSE